MSNSETYEEVAVSSEGVNVVKRFEEDEFPVPAIAFEFTSERDEEVSIRLTDDVPASVEVEDLGFHPEYGSEFWTIDDEQIVFEKSIGANSDYTTVYGIRATGTDDIEQFLTEPVLADVTPPLEDGAGESEDDTDGEVSDDVIPESDDDVVRDVISGDGEVPGLEDEEDETEEADGEDIDTLELKDPNAPDTEETTVTNEPSDDSDDEAEADAEDGDVTIEGSIVSAIATEIRENDVSVDDLKLLQRAIDKLSEDDESPDGATEARIERLQADISDLRAYTDALEEFLDENGTGEQLIEDFENQLEEFSSNLDRIESDVSTATDTVESVDSEVDEMQSEMESIDESVSELQDAVEDLEEEVTEGNIAERIDDIEGELEDLRDWQEQIKSTFGG